ncbi:hypothetical protein L0Z36_05380 [Burkholderia multivorans]|uniref:hypothetical protein n=1 Tax=Burkholderia multivorans TaxID=87883 RepID=UPI00143EB530|nr:hypothetical protein [Burkholderia multivorans]QIX17194.1 hypothetical protein FOB32_16410 [Burkholderia multivorans]UQP01366.1 hypothetical protein L0Z36_05380 [Burkholderia multivorans]
MDELARSIGYAVIETAIGASILVGAMYLAVKTNWFARACKIAFLAAWMLFVTAVPLYGFYISWDRNGAIGTIIGGAIFMVAGPLPFFYIGWPELVKAVRGQD